MSRYTVKVNCSGSWANLIHCDANRLPGVKAACEDLAKAHGGSISFKVIDAAGDTVAFYNSQPRQREPHGWYAVSNPIQSGLDRTTSGAIGQP